MKEHDTQFAAGTFLLEALNQPDDEMFDIYREDLSDKKISLLVSRQRPVPDGIKQASLVPELMNNEENTTIRPIHYLGSKLRMLDTIKKAVDYVDPSIGCGFQLTMDAKTHLQKLKVYNKDLFETPKPERLIGRTIEIATDEGDLVMDCFLGSGTTASTAHKMHRHYICIEENATICKYINDRMEKVIEGEKGGISKDVGWRGGGQYEYVEWGH